MPKMSWIKSIEINSIENNFIKIASIWITIVLLAAIVVMTGCIENKKIDDQVVSKTPVVTAIATQTSPKTTQTGIFSVSKGKKEGPSTPITISMSIPDTLNLNEIYDINITVKSAAAAPDTRVELILTEGISMVSSNSSWNANLKANSSETFSAKIKITKTGNGEITATAKRIIDQENSWGDIDVAYINYPSSQNEIQIVQGVNRT